jgi:hypothetical protein
MGMGVLEVLRCRNAGEYGRDRVGGRIVGFRNG